MIFRLVSADFLPFTALVNYRVAVHLVGLVS